MSIFVELLIISILVAITSALPGNFLVLRGSSLTTFALSHSVLLGIVLLFILTGDLNSPWLFVGATLTGVVIVWLVELLAKSEFIHHDASLGMVYLFFFSLAILLVVRFASGTSLSTKSIVTGNIALVPFDRIHLFGIDFGPRLIWIMSGILLLNVLFVSLFYKELKVTTFDPEYAKLLGFMPTTVNMAFMTLVSLTIVAIFRVVGVILVVALMIIPPAAAYLLTRSLPAMISLSLIIAILSSISGMVIAWKIADIEIASVITVICGVLFLASLILSQQIDALKKLEGRGIEDVNKGGIA